MRPVILALALSLTALPASAHELDGSVAGADAPPAGLDLLSLVERLLASPAEAAANVAIDNARGWRLISANGIPDHDTGRFPNRDNPNSIRAQEYRVKVSLTPALTGTARSIGHNIFGIALNGVMFDPGTAEFWHGQRQWNYEALTGRVRLGLDRNNAHVQPDGNYHYHGIPTGLVEKLQQAGRPVLLGWAADGFPVYGPLDYSDPRDAGGALRDMGSSWRVKTGTRAGGPGGTPDGGFTADWTYVAGAGDLDECNGRFGVTPEFPGGIYHYVLTSDFPFVPRCWKGTPDSSFNKRGPHLR